MLTYGWIQNILTNDTTIKPHLQILDVKKLTCGASEERFRIVLSDGQYYMHGMLGIQCAKKISNELKQFCIIHLKDFGCVDIHGKKICVIECNVVQQMMNKIGRPKNPYNIYPVRVAEEKKESLYDNSEPKRDEEKKEVSLVSCNGIKMNTKVWEYKTNENVWKAYDDKMQVIIEELKLGEIHQFTMNKQQQQIYKITTEIAAHSNLSTKKNIDIRRTTQSCSYYNTAKKILQQEFPSIPSEYFDAKNGNKCYCNECHNARGDKIVYTRGKPAKKYGLPIGFARFGMKVHAGFVKMHNVFEQWHACYHGTKKETVSKIFGARGTLLKPGDVSIGGNELGVRDGHIKKAFKRWNEYSQKREMFDPNQIYISPSIHYAAHQVYAKWVKCKHPFKKNQNIKVQFVFQCRIRPGSYNIGQETVGAAKSGVVLDQNFTNNEVEWYTKENVGITLHGLLLRFKRI